MNKQLRCINGGRVEVVKGEARSAEAKEGDIFNVTSEESQLYYGTLQTAAGFIRDPSLSGRAKNHGLYKASDLELVITKANVKDTPDPRGFWATWAEMTPKEGSMDSKKMASAVVAEFLKQAKDWDPNPWAVCTAKVGREDKAKYERCVQHVKAKQK